MPRIRKKTSNRQNTRDRAKIKKKVKESNRKTRKHAKRDVTWKSNKKKDMGIPNSFPFKDQVLAEQAEEKRLAEEARLESRRRPVQEEEDTPGVALVNTAVLKGSVSLRVPAESAEEEDEEDAEVPDLVDTHLTTLQEVLDRADVVLQVVDARDIIGCRSKYIEKLVREADGKVGLVINKIDLVPRETLESWLPHLPKDTFLFKSHLSTANIPSSSKTPLPHNPEQTLGKTQLLAAFERWSAGKSTDEPLVVALMGLPNVGKTSVLNSLLGRAKGQYATAPVIPPAAAGKALTTTTQAPVEVAVPLGVGADAKSVHVIDTPGWEFAEEDHEEEEEEEEEDDEEELSEEKLAKYDKLEATLAGDMLRRNLGRVDKVKDAFPLVKYIVTRSNPQDLMLAYNVPYFTPGDVEAFLTSLARVTARIKKHGDADLDSSARVLLRDWAHSTFPFYVVPPKSAPTANGAIGAGAHAEMNDVLAAMRTRKEMRASGKGLVRFRTSDEEEREIVLDDDYTAHALPSDDEDEDEDDEDGKDGEEEEHDDDDEAGDDELHILPEDGEELELEDGPEPSSGSDVEEDDEDESDEEEEEEEEVEEPVPAPAALQSKLKRKLAASPEGKAAKRSRQAEAAKGKGKRVSFGRDVLLNPSNGAKGSGKGEGEFKGLGKRRR